MSRISQDALVSAVVRVRAMDLIQKEQRADELFLAQPNFFASFMVQQKLGVSLVKMDFLLDHPAHLLPGDEGIRLHLAPHYGR